MVPFPAAISMFVLPECKFFFSQTFWGSDFLCTYYLIYEPLDHGSQAFFGGRARVSMEGTISGTPQLLGNLPSSINQGFISRSTHHPANVLNVLSSQKPRVFNIAGHIKGNPTVFIYALIIIISPAISEGGAFCRGVFWVDKP